jgi:hypothetical protein
MDAWVLVFAFGMPAAIFLVALRALVVRRRLEGQGARTGATIVEVRAVSGSTGEAEEFVTYRFVAAGQEYTGSAYLSAGRRPRAVGDTIDVLYRIARPSYNQPYVGGVGQSAALNVIVMIGMAATVAMELFLLSLVHR